MKMLETKCLVILILTSYPYLFTNAAKTKTFIIHMDKSAKPQSFASHVDWYSSKLNSVLTELNTEDQTQTQTQTQTQKDRIIYTYQTAFHGLAAQLTQQEANLLELQDGVLSVFPEVKYSLHTTRSPMFLGLEPHVTTARAATSTPNVFSQRLSDHDVIVGVLDTGVWPESPSFNDTGMSPVPVRWRGACEKGRGFTKLNCNRKVVGARIFFKGYEAATGKFNEQTEYKSPRDQDGHGTHTAATVAGAAVHGANLLGYAAGTARGMAPAARIAAYKVCWVGGCFSSDIMAAVDKAVADGVDVLSISLGGGVSSYYRDSLSIAAFGAMQMGLFVSCSAGNGGPDPVTLTNVSPWITTVGASTMDRDFPGIVKLGDGRNVSGVSLYRGRMRLDAKRMYPLVFAGGNSSSSTPDPSSLCLEGTLDARKVKGKIVICERGISPRVQKGEVVRNAGGVGMILVNTASNGEELVADCHLLPAVAVGANAARLIKHYAMSSARAKATLAFVGTRVGVRPSPVVAAFSSRGPNLLSFEVMKPDLVAPGVNILAAWTGDLGPSSLATDQRRVKFNILSGTSMSCPHVSGIAALLKSRHPEWSPAAIKSALMTTAYVHDNTNKPLGDASRAEISTPFDHGAGHINPVKALDPGLVYDITPQDYLEFLCTHKLTPTQLKVFSNNTCRHTLANAGDLNYPAISVLFVENSNVSTLTIHRTVTNVGRAVSSYHTIVSLFKGAYVKVEPRTLKFTKANQKLSYKVTFTTKTRQPEPEFGGLVWKDGVHRVRSPIVVAWGMLI